MRRLMTLSMGMLLLVIGSIGFLGCSDGGAPVSSGTPISLNAQIGDPAAPTGNADSTANVQTIPGATATAQLNSMTFTAPTGMALSTTEGAYLSFTGTNVSTTSYTLPLVQSGDNLTTNGIAVFAPGMVTMTFPTITMTPLSSKSRVLTGTLTFNNFKIVYEVNGSSWTLPSAYTINLNLLSNGYYTLGSSVATATWDSSVKAPSSAMLTLQLYSDSTYLGWAIQTRTPSNGTIAFTGTSNVPFNAIGSTANPAILNLAPPTI